MMGKVHRTTRSAEEAQGLSPAMLMMAPLEMWPVATKLQSLRQYSMARVIDRSAEKEVQVPSVDESYNRKAMSAAVILSPKSFLPFASSSSESKVGLSGTGSGEKTGSADLART